VGAGDERVLQFGVDVDGDVVDLDVGVDGVEVVDDALEDLEEVAGAVPDGDLALGVLGGGRLERVGAAAFAPLGGDGRPARGQAEPSGRGERGRSEGSASEVVAKHGHSLV